MLLCPARNCAHTVPLIEEILDHISNPSATNQKVNLYDPAYPIHKLTTVPAVVTAVRALLI